MEPAIYSLLSALSLGLFVILVNRACNYVYERMYDCTSSEVNFYMTCIVLSYLFFFALIALTSSYENADLVTGWSCLFIFVTTLGAVWLTYAIREDFIGFTIRESKDETVDKRN